MKKNRKVLIVDDSRLICWAVGKALSAASCHVTPVYNGRDALKEIVNTQYYLVFLDIYLPDMNGLAVLDEIKKAAPETIVVVMSADGSDNNKKLARKKGASHFIEKPFDLSEIRDIINNTFAGDLKQPQTETQRHDLRIIL
jgi:DNA-binding NtrC family response regulator